MQDGIFGELGILHDWKKNKTSGPKGSEWRVCRLHHSATAKA